MENDLHFSKNSCTECLGDIYLFATHIYGDPVIEGRYMYDYASATHNEDCPLTYWCSKCYNTFYICGHCSKQESGEKIGDLSEELNGYIPDVNGITNQKCEFQLLSCIAYSTSCYESISNGNERILEFPNQWGLTKDDFDEINFDETSEYPSWIVTINEKPWCIKGDYGLSGDDGGTPFVLYCEKCHKISIHTDK